jgi:uncharacterized repeat protein (TIGR03803 family)
MSSRQARARWKDAIIVGPLFGVLRSDFGDGDFAVMRICNAVGSRAKREHLRSAVCVEGLEGRVLFSGYSLVTRAELPGSGVGFSAASPGGAPLVDDAGDIFVVSNSVVTGGATDGSLLEVPAGSNSVKALGFLNLLSPTAGGGVGNLVMDSSGDVFGVTNSASGTLFEWVKSTGKLQTLVDFNAAAGSQPGGGLAIDGEGNIYGTTTKGGAAGAGMIFDLAKGGATLTELASFAGGTPSTTSSLVVDPAGNLFGENSGEIYELPVGSSVVRNLANLSDANGGLTFDGSGNLYGTTGGPGSAAAATVFKYSVSSGTLTTVATFASANSYPDGTLYLDGAGNIYGMAGAAPGTGFGSIFEVVKGSGTVSTIYSFTGGTDAEKPDFGFVVDSAGTIDGVTTEGVAPNTATIFSLVPNAGAADQLAFVHQPSDVAIGGLMNSPSVWVAVENANGEIVRTDQSAVTLSVGSGTTLAGTLVAKAHDGVAVFSGAALAGSSAPSFALLATDGNLGIATSGRIGVAAGGSVDTASIAGLSGWAEDPSDSSSELRIEVDISGGPTQTFLADENRPDLTKVIGSANHGFTYAMPVLSVGSHTVNVYAFQVDGRKILLGSRVVVSQNSLFDEHYYLQMNPDVAAAVAKGIFATGYDQYIADGQYEGRSPSPYWDEAYYLQQNPDVAAAVKNHQVSSGFMHYYLYGQYENRPGVLYFNASYYLSTNPDVAAAVKAGTVASAFEHFVLFGQYEGRSPMLYFSSAVYDSNNPDILPYVTGETLSSDFEQFVEYGQFEGRVASNYYNEKVYLADNPDVAAAVKAGVFADGFLHWLVYGQYEGRKA